MSNNIVSPLRGKKKIDTSQKLSIIKQNIESIEGWLVKPPFQQSDAEIQY